MVVMEIQLCLQPPCTGPLESRCHCLVLSPQASRQRKPRPRDISWDSGCACRLTILALALRAQAPSAFFSAGAPAGSCQSRELSRQQLTRPAAQGSHCQGVAAWSRPGESSEWLATGPRLRCVLLKLLKLPAPIRCLNHTKKVKIQAGRSASLMCSPLGKN